jgi:serine/threonine protein kinase/tetratricopeptide (TPR) repeat protein
MSGKANSSPTPAQPIAAQADPTPERWQRIKELFVEAQQRKSAERSAFLRLECGEDESLRRDVESLLAAAESEVTEPAAAGTAAGSVREDPIIGRRIGPYKIIQQIGRGGMATVYLAARADEQYEKQVAIKILLPELESDELLFRFRNERQTLAKLDHPNIVKLLDGGTDEDGLPYLVMDYVEGAAIDQYCDTHKLSTEQRLNLFCQVCAAVQCAHQNLVVHRDLKPSNILVTADGQPKLLDFGISKVLHSTTALAVTKTVARRMTPAYASPEQVRGEQVTPATDIYSLGVVLYELLTGHRPYKLKQNTPAEVERAICEQEPEKPSTAVNRVEEDTLPDGTTVSKTPEIISALREGHPEKLRRRLKGDLDTIVLNALQKESKRRYLSVEHLSGDIRLHLQHRPVKARRSTFIYRSSKFIRRHTSEIIAAALIVMVILGAIGLVVREKRQAIEKARAELAIQRSRGRRSVAVLGFKNLSGRPDTAWISTALSEMLTTELSAGGKLRTIPGESVAETRINLALPEGDALSPATLGRVYANLGSECVVLGSYLDLGDSGRTIRLDLRAQDAALQETIATLTETGSEATLPELVTRAGAALRERLGVSGLAPAEVASVQASLPADPEAMRLYAEGLARLRAFDAMGAKASLQKAVATDSRIAIAHSALADAWAALGYNANAQDEAKKAFELTEGLPREQSLWIEGRYHQDSRQWEKAIEIYRTLANFFPDNLEYALRLAQSQASGNRTKDCLNTLENLRKLPPPIAQDVRVDLAEADALGNAGDFKRESEVATRAAEKAQARGAKTLLADARLAQAEAFRNLSDSQRSKALCSEARQVYASVGDRFGEARALRCLGAASDQIGEFRNAATAFQESADIYNQLGNRAGEAKMLANVGIVLGRQGKYDQATQLYQHSVAILRELRDWPDLSATLQGLGAIEKDMGKLADANTHVLEALDLDRAAGSEAKVAGDLSILAQMRSTEGDSTSAKKMLHECIRIFLRSGDRNSYAIMLNNLAGVYMQTGDLVPAEKLYKESIAVGQEVGDQGVAAVSMMSVGYVRLTKDDLEGANLQFDGASQIIHTINPTDWTPSVAQATLLLEEGRTSDAEALLRQSIAAFHEQHDVNVEADAQTVLIRALLDQNKIADAQAALLEIQKLISQTAVPELHIEANIASASVLLASGKITEARRILQDSIEAARKRGFRGHLFEAQLLMGEVERKAGHRASANALLSSLAKDAEQRGFKLIARKARMKKSSSA